MDSDSSGHSAALRDAALFRRNSFQCSQAQNPHPTPLPSDGRGGTIHAFRAAAFEFKRSSGLPLPSDGRGLG